MNKFLKLKNKLINSKRQSQKIDQQELNMLFKSQSSLGQHNLEVNAKMKAKVNKITCSDYKLMANDMYQTISFIKNKTCKLIPEELGSTQNFNTLNHIDMKKYNSSQNKENAMVMTTNLANFNRNTILEEIALENDLKNTVKKDANQPFLDNNFSKILQKISQINKLQRLKQDEEDYARREISSQIRSKLSEVKKLLSNIQNRNLMDFYQQQTEKSEKVDSFHSYSSSSKQTYQQIQMTERQGYQFNQTDENQDIQIKYKRVSNFQESYDQQSDCYQNQQERKENSLYKDTQSFNRSIIDYEQNQDNICYLSPQKNDKSIVHLFTYEKQKFIDSQLSKISQRSHDYQSISHEKYMKNAEKSYQDLCDKGIQDKKIRFLLQSNDKNKKSHSSRHEISQFSISYKSQLQSSYRIEANTKKDRSKCHEELKQMINLLENKYHRKVNLGISKFMKSSRQILNDKKVDLRSKKFYN